ncbi:PUB domain containing protein [Nitzschia inconspicua]|uniref:PUB domain containing protein n=1 Tax=Nitzschia inconspicua TaxID=303405 RepID=A0A9K3LUT7_9STRA|nr:PUB domain containing protein [Nitzschia inconspicua]
MTLIEIGSAPELTAFLNAHPVSIVCFSAHWCGPCRASKPQLQEMARTAPIPIGYTYESDLGDFLHTFHVRAFPTYMCMKDGKEVERVEGVNFAGIQQMIDKHAKAVSSMPETGGNTLGGSHSAAEARALRLAKLGGGGGGDATATADAAADRKPAAEPKTEAAEGPIAMATDSGPAAPTETTDGDVAMDDASPATAPASSEDPTKNLDQTALDTLTGEMGFSLLRAQKGLLFSTAGTVESAVEWLMEHQDDADIDEPIPEGSVAKARSYKCNDCGKILSNMANLELHANKTGHSDFEESTTAVKPLTAEEKAAKIAEIKELLKAKRAEREEAEKVDHIEREKQRRFQGKEMAKTREEMEKEQRKREALARKREKQDAKRERDRIRAELEKDKRERAANKGKLQSTLGVDGYNPSAIQYDNTPDGDEPLAQKPKTSGSASAAKIDEYITKVSSYRAGGDGGKCLKVLKLLVGNAADNPGEEKFKKINTETNAYKSKVKPFLGAKSLLLAVGFAPKDNDPTHLVLKDDADSQLLKDTKEKLEKALVAYG